MICQDMYARLMIQRIISHQLFENRVVLHAVGLAASLVGVVEYPQVMTS